MLITVALRFRTCRAGIVRSRRASVFGDNGGVIGLEGGAMLGFLKNLFGGGADNREPEPADPVNHAGFTIVPTPRRTGGGWSTEGRIRKDVGGEVREVHFIRADTSPSRDAAVTLSVGKARKIIDEQGEQVFRSLRA